MILLAENGKWKLILLLVAHLRPRICGGKLINLLSSHEER